MSTSDEAITAFKVRMEAIHKFLRLCNFATRILDYGEPFVLSLDFDSCNISWRFAF
jgi:hypothetical protein